MGLLKHIRSRSKIKSQQELQDYPKPSGPDRLSRLPKPILCRVLNHVCPHTMDETYEDSEKSVMGDSCGLCDLRDLARCALVNRHWYLTVQDVLYDIHPSSVTMTRLSLRSYLDIIACASMPCTFAPWKSSSPSTAERNTSTPPPSCPHVFVFFSGRRGLDPTLLHRFSFSSYHT